MISGCARLLRVFSGLAILAAPAAASPLLILTLSPNTYTVPVGGQVTLSGLFTTADPVTWTFDGPEFLFGLTPQSPHLIPVGGSILSSMNFVPPVGNVSFEDQIGGGGYLGPGTILGPTTTSISNLRTFTVPGGTPAGTYSYSYGAEYSANAPMSSVLFDQSLQIIVPVPEPAALWLSLPPLVLLGLVAIRRSGLFKPAA